MIKLKGFQGHFTGDLYATVKRATDLLLAVLALLCAAPLFFLIAVGIRATSPGPVFFCQLRLGRALEPFVLYKFRTMSCRAPRNTPTAALAGGYITPFGRLLRRFSLDELPQLLNILRGDMSFIGPRPVVLCEGDLVDRRIGLGVYRVRPGLSGLSQILGRDRLQSREKAALDRLYIRTANLRQDLCLLLWTLLPVLTGRGLVEGTAEIRPEKHP